MAKTGNILVIDDNKAVLTSLEMLLSLHFEAVTCISSPNLIADTLRKHPDIDVALLDMNYHAGINNGNEGLFWLKEIKRLKPSISIILFTAYADIELAVNSIKIGAVDFIEKPWDNRKLVEMLDYAVKVSRNGGERSEPEPETIVGGTLEDMERNMIKAALHTFSGNMSEVATRLGITRQTLYNKIKKYDL